MIMTSDAELARMLQLQFDDEVFCVDTSESSHPNGKSDSSGSMGIVDERWELIDPNPDIRALFMQFNDRFFWGRLEGVEVKWSPRMTLCAGLCCYEGYGGLCSIRLSQPLLKLRPRKDLVETLLHEMIHAYLFVTQNNKDHDGHGPEFCKHMTRINKATGTHISIYHTFHDEVDSYRQHWWRCDGPCRQRKPYYGYVRRAMNRAPSEKDYWWADHQRSCGGTYTKVKEPEGYGEKKGKKKKQNGDEGSELKGQPKNTGNSSRHGMDIRNFIPFSGKGQSVGTSSAQVSSAVPAMLSSSSSSSSKSKINLTDSSSTNRTSNGKPGVSAKRKSSSTDLDPKSDISSFFIKKHGGSSSPSQRHAGGGSASVHTDSSPSTTAYDNRAEKRSIQKPRFTPVVATASGKRVTDNYVPQSERYKSQDEKVMVDGGLQKMSKVSIPVSASDKQETNNHSCDKDNKSSFERGKIGSSIGHDKWLSKATGVSETAGGSRDVLERNFSGKRSNTSSSDGGRTKRARLIDLQAMFDSDSEEECTTPQPRKHPVYNVDCKNSTNDVYDVERSQNNRPATGPDKENANSDNSAGLLTTSDRNDSIILSDDSESETAMNDKSHIVTSGIWKDLSHLSSRSSSSNDRGNRRFGRVTPPRLGKSTSKTKGASGGQERPQSSFSQHPWQTAARNNEKKALFAVTRVTDSSGVIDLVCDNTNGHGAGELRSGSPVQIGPKTVPCPVCNLQIEEKKINAHLDTCLTYNCDALFTP
ncbi:uncharacterized protein [Diadema antillarum]|uniref:uncharacterized protein n=1 Tax=Diadema antillarum TaxID=105358 RepID=UPI003A89168E